MRNSFGFLKDLGKVFTCKNVQQLFQKESSNSKNFDKGIVFDKDEKLFQKSLILKILQQFSTPQKFRGVMNLMWRKSGFRHNNL